MQKENPLTLLEKKYEVEEIKDLVEITLQELKTIGFVTFYFRIKHLIKPYLFWSSMISLIFIMFGNADLWTFFIPTVPVLLLWTLFLIDFISIQFSLLKAQKRLQKFFIKQISWDDMVYASVIAIAIREPMDEEEDDYDESH
jgi:hypothetical protein